MRFFLLTTIFISLNWDVLAGPLLQAVTPCDAAIEASEDPSVHYQEPLQDTGTAPATINDWNKDHGAALNFPIGISPSELRPGASNLQKLDETVIGVGGVSIDGANSDISVLGRTQSSPAATPPIAGGCTHLNGK